MTEAEISNYANWSKLASDGSFEAAFDALEQSVALLEAGGLSLSMMTDYYEVGLRLSKRCNDLLRSAELRVSVLEQSLIDTEDHSTTPEAFEE